MQTFTQVLAASALISLASTAPTSQKRAPSFQISQTANPNFVKSGHYAAAKTLAKYGGSPEKIASILATGAAKAGTVTATPQQYDSEYLCPVTIGNQKFTLDFDTGSSDTWVFGKGVGGSGHTQYVPSSSASKVSGATWKIQYGDGSSASGVVYKDTITVGGTTVTGQAIEAATKASSAFSSGVEDGLLGLAFDSINTVTPTKQKTFLTNAIAQGLTGVFYADLKAGKAGSYGFGSIDNTKHTGSIAYTAVDSSQGFWYFTPSSGDAGIADTGTSLIYVGDSTVSNYYSQVSGASQDSDGNWNFPCGTSLPSFSITVSGYKATVPGSYMNFAPNGDGTCFGGLQSDDSIGFAIYGDVFLKSQFVVFDRSGSSPRLGFAPKTL